MDLKKAIVEPCIVSPDLPLSEAISLMSQLTGRRCNIIPEITNNLPDFIPSRATSCIVVMEDNKLLGLLTERDIVKFIVAKKEGHQLTVRDIMAQNLITLKESEFTDIFIAYSLMKRNHIRHLPILDEVGNFVGIVTLTSLRQSLNMSYFLRFRRVMEVMNYQVVTATAQTPVFELAQSMAEQNISCIVITEKRNTFEIPIGIVTERDIVQLQSLESNFYALPAQKIMSCPVLTVTPEESLAKIYRQMQTHKIRRLVVAGTQGELLGLVTQSTLSQVIDPIEICGILEILHHRVDQLENTKNQLLEKQGFQLSKALENEEFLLFYQPQIDLKSGEIIGVEALIRWHSPERGWVSPSEFIPVAESTDLIHPLGEWVLYEACQQAVKWQRQGFPPLQMAVNVSGKQLNHPHFVTQILQILQRTRLDPRWLKLELTESLLVQNIEMTLDIFQTLKGLGIQIAIDDFGTGYASLGYLQHFPFDTLKIDRCFVTQVDQNSKNAAIVGAVIQMAHRLNFQAIAEGVEREAERDCLRAYGCDAMQGYLVSPPLPAQELEALLRCYAYPNQVVC